ncbi:MAG: zf-HC2 domain-containing protein [Nitrospira sp.]|nr:zf-HC2 domain-containing protein [Nitrospira sp.]
MAREGGQPTFSVIACHEIAQGASLYLDEQVEDERKRQIAMHLAICAGCETYVKQIATVRDVVGLLPKVVEQPSDSNRLRQVFAERARPSPAGG